MSGRASGRMAAQKMSKAKAAMVSSFRATEPWDGKDLEVSVKSNAIQERRSDGGHGAHNHIARTHRLQVAEEEFSLDDIMGDDDDEL